MAKRTRREKRVVFFLWLVSLLLVPGLVIISIYFDYRQTNRLKVKMLRGKRVVAVRDIERFNREILPNALAKGESDPHLETRAYIKALARASESGDLLIIVKPGRKEEAGVVFAGVAAEYIPPQKSKSGKSEIHLFFATISRFIPKNPDERYDFLVSLISHEWMHLETYRVYGEILAKHPGKKGFTEFLVWTNQIRSQLLDWKKQGRFLSSSQREAVAAYERLWQGDDKANQQWLDWVAQNIVR